MQARLEDAPLRIVVYVAFDDDENLEDFVENVNREILQCLWFCLSPSQYNAVKKDFDDAPPDYMSRWQILAAHLEDCKVTCDFLIDNYNVVINYGVSSEIDQKEAKKIHKFLKNILNLTFSSCTVISSANNFDKKNKSGVMPSSFYKKISMSNMEVLLFLGMYAQDTIRCKFGAAESSSSASSSTSLSHTVSLSGSAAVECSAPEAIRDAVEIRLSSFIKLEAERELFYKFTGFIPFQMKMAMWLNGADFFPGSIRKVWEEYQTFDEEMESFIDSLDEKHVGKKARSTVYFVLSHIFIRNRLIYLYLGFKL